MGVTIHYEGTLKSATDVTELLSRVRTFARERGWPVDEVGAKEMSLRRVVDEEASDYVGSVVGIVVHPHEDAEPLAFLVPTDLFVQDYCKTQFAGIPTHKAVVELLRTVAPLFLGFDVIDEAEFWESSDDAVLREIFAGFEQALANTVAEHPNAQVKVRLPSGRIGDVIT